MGDRVIRASWAGSAVFTLAEATAVSSDAFLIPAAVISLALFLIGCAAYVWSYVTAVQRSRNELIDLAGLFFLSGTAPKGVRWHLLGSVAAQVTVAIAGASVRPATATGILAPVYGLGLCGVWAARHGRFPSRSRR